jgi:hypothetical protein
MKKHLSKKPLALTSQTVRVLSNRSLESAAGGFLRMTAFPSCLSLCSDGAGGTCGCVPKPE